MENQFTSKVHKSLVHIVIYINILVDTILSLLSAILQLLINTNAFFNNLYQIRSSSHTNASCISLQKSYLSIFIFIFGLKTHIIIKMSLFVNIQLT